MQVTLYSGKQCHLCELAEQQINVIQQARAIKVQRVDVASEHDLYHLYGARIPVIKRDDTQQELAWPFSLVDLDGFLK